MRLVSRITRVEDGGGVGRIDGARASGAITMKNVPVRHQEELD
jgi:hypothetical protein